LEYQLPRLTRLWTHLSRMGGGIGTRRGPGETKMEVDRRRIRRRITRLRRDLEEMAKTRDVKRRGREQAGLPGVALAGYTNAGKSTLLNRLSGAGVLVEDKLFSTLDPTTRRLDLPAGRSVTLTDTVGFIAKLPHDLVEAFKSTLEEVALADLVVHLVDAAQPEPVAQVEAVRKVLTEVGAGGVPELLVLNKADLVDDLSRARLMRQFPGAPLVSAATGEGIDDLLTRLGLLAREAEDTQPERQPYVVLRPGRPRFTVTREGPHRWRVAGRSVERWVMEADLEDEHDLERLQKRMVKDGIERTLAAEGARHGDEVQILDRVFEFLPDPGPGPDPEPDDATAEGA
jgi:GTP-binding protein HflX